MPRAKKSQPVQAPVVETKPVDAPTPAEPVAPPEDSIDPLADDLVVEATEPVTEPIAPPAEPDPVVIPPEPAPVEPLAAFLARIQEAKLADDLVVVEASHPDTLAGHYNGKYSGFMLTPGPAAVRWNDGSTE